MEEYVKLLTTNEEWLMNKILEYARKYDFTKYTSTLPEAWRLSISGLSESIILAAKHFSVETIELHPDEKFTLDPISKFGVVEAQRHRERGTTLGMFLGLMKYYKESYIDLIELKISDIVQKEDYIKFTTRCFDRIEIAFCIEWSQYGSDELLNELQHANRIITNEKNKYLTIFESSYIPTIFLDDDFKVSNINESAAELFTDFKTAGSVYYNDHPSIQKLGDQISRFVGSGKTEVKFESVLSTNKGALLFLVQLKRMLDVSNKFMGTVIMLEDITVRKEMDKALKESEAKYKELNATKDRLFSIIAHDLRNPFCALLGFSDTLLENLHSYNDETIENQLTIINKTAEQTYGLLEDLLLWSKSQSGKLSFNPQSINLKELCEMVNENVKVQAEAKQIEIEYRIPGELELLADENMLRTILRNLLSNAIKFTNTNGLVEVKVDNDDINAFVCVSDNGVGISKEDQQKLWDFSEYYSTKGSGGEKGTGFGLVLCKEFIEKHGGKIWVESEVGQGSVFKITLPLAK